MQNAFAGQAPLQVLDVAHREEVRVILEAAELVRSPVELGGEHGGRVEERREAWAKSYQLA